MAVAANYWVDWDDPHNPEIRHARFHPDPWSTDEYTFVTFQEAKRQVVKVIDDELRHWREQRKQLGQLRKRDVDR